MSRFADKVLNGTAPDPTDWVEHLKEAHKLGPSMTPAAFERPRTLDGFNSYQMLVRELKRRCADPSRTLDLACGDGHLTRHMKESFGSELAVVGVDVKRISSGRPKEFSRCHFQVRNGR